MRQARTRQPRAEITVDLDRLVELRSRSSRPRSWLDPEGRGIPRENLCSAVDAVELGQERALPSRAARRHAASSPAACVLVPQPPAAAHFAQADGDLGAPARAPLLDKSRSLRPGLDAGDPALPTTRASSPRAARLVPRAISSMRETSRRPCDQPLEKLLLDGGQRAAPRMRRPAQLLRGRFEIARSRPDDRASANHLARGALGRAVRVLEFMLHRRLRRDSAHRRTPVARMRMRLTSVRAPPDRSPFGRGAV